MLEQVNYTPICKNLESKKGKGICSNGAYYHKTYDPSFIHYQSLSVYWPILEHSILLAGLLLQQGFGHMIKNDEGGEVW